MGQWIQHQNGIFPQSGHGGWENFGYSNTAGITEGRFVPFRSSVDYRHRRSRLERLVSDAEPYDTCPDHNNGFTGHDLRSLNCAANSHLDMAPNESA